jgi:hypothetical protein
MLEVIGKPQGKRNLGDLSMDLFPSSGESGGEDTYSVGLLRKS